MPKPKRARNLLDEKPEVVSNYNDIRFASVSNREYRELQGYAYWKAHWQKEERIGYTDGGVQISNWWLANTTQIKRMVLSMKKELKTLEEQAVELSDKMKLDIDVARSIVASHAKEDIEHIVGKSKELFDIAQASIKGKLGMAIEQNDIDGAAKMMEIVGRAGDRIAGLIHTGAKVVNELAPPVKVAAIGHTNIPMPKNDPKHDLAEFLETDGEIVND